MATLSIRPTTLKINEDIKARVTQLAKSRHRSAHGVMLEAIHQYVEREEQRESLRQDALHAWTEFRETGLHVKGEEVVSWLETWGRPDEQPAPQCHR